MHPKKLSDAGIHFTAGKETWNKRSIEKILENEKYTGTVTLLDSATQEYEYQMIECHPLIITKSEFRTVKEERAKRSNIVTDNSGTYRSSKKYNSKKKQQNFIFMEVIMNRQLQGIAIILCSILLSLAYGGNAVGDLSLRWQTIFVLLGIVGVMFNFWPNKSER